MLTKKAQAFTITIAMIGYIIALAIILLSLYQSPLIDTGTSDMKGLSITNDIELELLGEELQYKAQIYEFLEAAAKDGCNLTGDEIATYNSTKLPDCDMQTAVQELFTSQPTQEIDINTQNEKIVFTKKVTKEERKTQSYGGASYEVAYYPSQRFTIPVNVDFFRQTTQAITNAGSCLDESCLETEFNRLRYEDCKDEIPDEEDLYCFMSRDDYIWRNGDDLVKAPIIFLFKYQLPTPPNPLNPISPLPLTP